MYKCLSFVNPWCCVAFVLHTFNNLVSTELLSEFISLRPSEVSLAKKKLFLLCVNVKLNAALKFSSGLSFNLLYTSAICGLNLLASSNLLKILGKDADPASIVCRSLYTESKSIYISYPK